MFAFALVRALEIIGEAASNVSSEGRAAHPAIPWPLIVGMRHRAMHAHLDVEYDLVREIVTSHLHR